MNCDQHFFNPCCANARDCEDGMNDHPATGGASQPEEQTAFMSTDANEDAGIRCMNGHRPREQYPLKG